MNAVELDESVNQLVALIRGDRGKIDLVLACEGEALLALFTDEVAAKEDTNFAPCRQIAIRDAIDDLANGAPILLAGVIGVKHQDGKLEPFVLTHQADAEGPRMKTAYSIQLKKTAVSRAGSAGERAEIPQGQLNACIYFLITQLAE